MCCCEKTHHRSGSDCMGLWSKERKIKTLEEELKSTEVHSAEIKRLIDELKIEK